MIAIMNIPDTLAVSSGLILVSTWALGAVAAMFEMMRF
jgi:hypothetical protein